jgi:hypothetical protein
MENWACHRKHQSETKKIGAPQQHPQECHAVIETAVNGFTRSTKAGTVPTAMR